jgi:hypothetical protein
MAENNENPEGSPQFRNHCRLAELGKEATRCENTQPVRVRKERTKGMTKGIERNGAHRPGPVGLPVPNVLKQAKLGDQAIQTNKSRTT